MSIPNYTQAFIRNIPCKDGINGIFVPLADLVSFLDETPEARVYGFQVCTDSVEVEIVTPPAPCKPWRRIGRGRSWGYIQKGYICAGAGGVNSNPILKIYPKGLRPHPPTEGTLT